MYLIHYRLYFNKEYVYFVEWGVGGLVISHAVVFTSIDYMKLKTQKLNSPRVKLLFRYLQLVRSYSNN